MGSEFEKPVVVSGKRLKSGRRILANALSLAAAGCMLFSRPALAESYMDQGLKNPLELLYQDPLTADMPGYVYGSDLMLGFGELPPYINALYIKSAGSRSIVLSESLKDAPDLEKAIVLAHEITHAYDDDHGVPLKGKQNCLAAENRALRAQSEVYGFFKQAGDKIPYDTILERNILNTYFSLRDDQERFELMIAINYADLCKD